MIRRVFRLTPCAVASVLMAAGAAWAQPVGLGWRDSLGGSWRSDVAPWKHVAPESDAWAQSRRHYGDAARQRQDAPLPSVPYSGVIADRGMLGVQLESGARVSVKRRDGQPMLYYRNKF